MTVDPVPVVNRGPWATVGDARVALVTSAAHLPRAVGLFRQKGIETVPCPTDFTVRGILQQIVRPNKLNQTYLKAKDKFRKTWNNWLRLTRKRPKAEI